MINEIRNDKTHGASQLARQALEAIKVAAQESPARSATALRNDLLEVTAKLKSLRPSMVPIANSIQKLETKLAQDQSSETNALRQRIMAAADDLARASVEALTKIAAHTAQLVAERDVILTHSYSSTVAVALKAAYKLHSISVIVTRGGAGRTGERLAWELNLAGVPVTFIDDAAAGFYMPEANKVLEGADRICADRALVNAAGTLLVALAAKRAVVPFYVLCETLKFDAKTKSSEVEIEEKEPAEVAAPGALPEAVKVENPYFDITPADLITGIVTENGLVWGQQTL